MDFFKKNKVMAITIVFLVVLNLFTISVVLMKSHLPFRPFRNMPEHRMMREKGDRVMRFLSRKLQLDEEQSLQINKMRANHSEKMKTLNMEINDFKRQIMDESFSNEPDSAKISIYAENIGELWSDMAKLNYDHFRKVGTVLDSTQLSKFKELVKRILPMQGPPPDRQMMRSDKMMRRGERRGKMERRP